MANYNAGRAAWGAWGFNAEMAKRSLRKDLDPNKHRERSGEIWIKTAGTVPQQVQAPQATNAGVQMEMTTGGQVDKRQ